MEQDPLSSSRTIVGTEKYRQSKTLSCEQIAEMCEDLDQKDLNLSTTATTTTTTTTTTRTTNPKGQSRRQGLSKTRPSKKN